MAKIKKKDVKRNIVSGGLSSREKLASKNPAARAEGQRETASLSPERRKATLTGARNITKRGYTGTAKTSQVKEPTRQQLDKAIISKRQSTNNLPIPTQQSQTSNLNGSISATAPGQIPTDQAQPVVNTATLNPDIINQDLVSGQLQGNVETPENFGRDVAVGTALGTAGIIAGIGVISAATAIEAITLTTAGTAVQRAAAGQVTKKTIQKGIATNTVNAAKTTSYLGKLAKATTKPAFVATTLLSAIGSYPFSGFIKEEALQTISFGIKTSIDNEDVEGAEKSLQLANEVLNPDVWGQIISTVPYLNIQRQLQNFFKAAALKMEADSKAVEKLKANLIDFQPSKLQTAEEKRQDERFARIRSENQAAKLAEEKRQDERFTKIRADNAKRR